MGRLAGAIVLIFTFLAMVGCNDEEKPPANAGWRVGGNPPNEQALRFVEIDSAKSQDRPTYDAAAEWLCHAHAHGRNCGVAFLLTGDQIPPNDGSTVRLVPLGGWDRYAEPLAVYWANDVGSGGKFSSWDCTRAGEQGAPATALCGSLKQINTAVLQLAGRVAWVEACGLPPTSGGPKVLAYSKIDNTERRNMLQNGYSSFLKTRSGNPADCVLTVTD
jgi:hypothetical protein